MQLSIIEALALLTPYDVDKRKERIGPSQDGGYILLPELFDNQPVLSYGISTEYRFDIEMAVRGHEVFMFDHTIGGINNPQPKLQLNWIKEGVAGTQDKRSLLNTLENHLAKYAAKACDLILKMDVEGFEYEAFDATPRATLRRFQQIVFEIHDLNQLQNPEFRSRFVRVLTKLNSDFTLFHVHANNYDGRDTYTFLAGLPVSNLLELSFVRTNLVKRKQSETLYPTPLDYPNVHPQDKKLWFFPFLPTNLKPEAFCAADQRIESVAQLKTQEDRSDFVNAPNAPCLPQAVIRSSADNLFDLAHGKVASQSSSSAWSLAEESVNAISKDFVGDWAFHTEREENPWWQVDLGAAYPIELIIIHNRRHAFQDRARTLKVEIAESLDDWILVHAGIVHFGAEGDGIPLALTLNSRVNAQYVRLSLTEYQYLHLSRVQVLARLDIL